MVLDQVGIALIGAIIGAAAGFFFFYGWEKKKKLKEISKVKELINDDYTRLYKIANEGISDSKNFLENTDNIDKLVDELIRTKFDISIVIRYHYPLEHNFWNAIMTNGSLIKLNLEEIKYIQNNYEYITTQNDALQNAYHRWQNVIAKMVGLGRELASAEKKELFNSTVIYFERVEDYCNGIRDVLVETKSKFDWIGQPK